MASVAGPSARSLPDTRSEHEVIVLANEQTDAGEYASALALLESATEVERRPEAATLRGWCLENLGRLEEAEASYAVALSRAPSDLEALEGSANILWSLGRPAKAVVHWQAVAKIVGGLRAPTPRELELSGWSLYRLGRLNEAEACLQRALTLDPSALSVRFDLALVLLALGNAELALEQYALAVEQAHQAGIETVRGVVSVALDDFLNFSEAVELGAFGDVLERIRALLAGASSPGGRPGKE